MKLYTKLFAIQGKVSVTKDGINPHFRSKYMTLDNIVETLTPELNTNKILVTHFIEKGTLTTRIVDIETAEILDSHFPMNATDPQKVGSEITYAKRYNLVALFNICADDDDDGNMANTPEKKEYPRTPKDDIIDQMGICNDIEELKTLYATLLTHAKSPAQTKFFEGIKDKQKSRIEKLNIHTA